MTSVHAAGRIAPLYVTRPVWQASGGDRREIRIDLSLQQNKWLHQIWVGTALIISVGKRPTMSFQYRTRWPKRTK